MTYKVASCRSHLPSPWAAACGTCCRWCQTLYRAVYTWAPASQRAPKGSSGELPQTRKACKPHKRSSHVCGQALRCHLLVPEYLFNDSRKLCHFPSIRLLCQSKERSYLPYDNHLCMCCGIPVLLHQIVSFDKDVRITNQDCTYRDFASCCSLQKRTQDKSLCRCRLRGSCSLSLLWNEVLTS